MPTLDEKAWRATEPHTPHPRKRLEAVAELNRAGIPTGVLIAPLMPGINDDPEQVERILELADGGGRDAHRRHRAAPARRGARRLLRLAARPSGPTSSPRYEELYRARRVRAAAERRSGCRDAGPPRAAGAPSGARGRRRDRPAARRAAAEAAGAARARQAAVLSCGPMSARRTR